MYCHFSVVYILLHSIRMCEGNLSDQKFIYSGFNHLHIIACGELTPNHNVFGGIFKHALMDMEA